MSMMSTLMTVMRKELRDISRDRRTLALALLLGPLLYPLIIIGTSTAAAAVGMLLTWSMVAVEAPDGQVTAVPSESGYLWAAGISLGACVVASLIALAIPPARPLVEEKV